MLAYSSKDERRIREERERKKAEVRARLEAQASNKSKKKGFMTPERKKKLRLLLRKKAAEELKRQQEAKANERRRVISERTGTKKNFDAMSADELRSVCRQMHERLSKLEDEKWDLESEVSKRGIEIHQLSTTVSDSRGKFVKPPLKHVPKYQAKIERMLLNARKEVGFSVNLKAVKKDQFKVEESRENKDQAAEWILKKESKQQSQSQQQEAAS